MKKKRWASILMTLMLLSMAVLAACSSSGNTESSTESSSGTEATTDSDKTPNPVKLKLAIWDSKTDIEFWSEKIKEYSTVQPHVTVELEKVPDNEGQYLKIRMAANNMPDLFFYKPAQFQTYKEKLLPLDDVEATANNKFPTVEDGKTYGLPLVSFSEFVYYHPSIFKELGLEVPTTLPAFLELMDKIKQSGKYVPVSIGAKDSWTFYPYMEFGPHILSGDEGYLAKLAQTNEPFGEGSTFDQVAKLLKNMADKKYAGPDALGISFDQSTQQFEANKAAMIALGQWYYSSYMNNVGTDEDLAVFPLPLRSSESEPLLNMTMSDLNIGISTDSKNPDEAKAFLNWMFSPEVYQTYINKVQQLSTMSNVTADVPFFNKWTKENAFESFVYQGTDAKYAAVKAAAQYDQSLAAQEIYAGKSIEQIEKELNDRWSKAVTATP